MSDHDVATYKPKEVAKILQLPVNVIYREAASGRIPGRIVVAGRVRFNAAAIDRLVAGEAA